MPTFNPDMVPVYCQKIISGWENVYPRIKNVEYDYEYTIIKAIAPGFSGGSPTAATWNMSYLGTSLGTSGTDNLNIEVKVTEDVDYGLDTTSTDIDLLYNNLPLLDYKTVTYVGSAGAYPYSWNIWGDSTSGLCAAYNNNMISANNYQPFAYTIILKCPASCNQLQEISGYNWGIGVPRQFLIMGVENPDTGIYTYKYFEGLLRSTNDGIEPSKVNITYSGGSVVPPNIYNQPAFVKAIRGSSGIYSFVEWLMPAITNAEILGAQLNANFPINTTTTSTQVKVTANNTWSASSGFSTIQDIYDPTLLSQQAIPVLSTPNIQSVLHQNTIDILGHSTGGLTTLFNSNLIPATTNYNSFYFTTMITTGVAGTETYTSVTDTSATLGADYYLLSPSDTSTSVITLYYRGTVSTNLYPPTDPTNLSATSISYTSATLNWTASTDADGNDITYYIYYKNTTSPTWVFAGTSSVNTATYNLSGLSSDTTYDVRIKAFDGLYYSNYDTSSALFSTLNYAPSQPSDLSSSSITASGSHITWAASVDPEGSTVSYRVYSFTTLAGIGSAVLDGTTTNLYMDLTGLIANTSYGVEVIPSDGVLDGTSLVNTSLFTTLEVAPTTPVVIFINASMSSLNVAWTSTGSSYDVSYKKHIDSTYVSFATNYDSSIIGVTGLFPRTAYDVEVIAFNDQTYSAPGIIDATTLGFSSNSGTGGCFIL